MVDISNMRHDFNHHEAIDITQLPDCPFILFKQWFDLASQTKKLAEPNGFVLATANTQGRLRSRTVLLKYFDQSGFVFYTNYGSQKAKDITENPQASMCFPWYGLERQLMIEGQVQTVSKMESLSYFASRPKGSQIGAWVSQQSQIISSRALLMEKVKQLTQHYCGKDVPLPDFWGGYRIVPERFEFWQGQPSRLHDRIEYQRQDNHWLKQRLSP